MSMRDEEQRLAVIKGLLKCAAAHDRGEFSLIEREFDTFEQALPQDATQISDDVLLAFNFWDAWVDSKNHGWQFYDPLLQKDWPMLARDLATYLQDRTAVLNPIIERKFGSSPISSPWYVRVSRWIRRGAG